MGKFADWTAELNKETANPSSAPAVVAPAIPDTSYATTTATTPSEAKKEKIEVEKEKMRAGDFVDSATAAGYGAARGATLGAVDRLVGIGSDLGETLASMNPNVTPADPNAYSNARQEYLSSEAKAKKDHEGAYLGGELAASTIPMLASAGSSAATTVAPRTIAQTVASGVASPAGRLAAQNFVSGSMNERSDSIPDQIRSGVNGVALGAVAGKAADATVGKAIEGASARELRGITQDILRNSETDIAATATARKRFYERADSAIKEVKGNKVMGAAVREGDAAAVANMARSKLQEISEPRAGMYKELDSVSMLGIDEIDAAIRKAERTATGAKRQALEGMRSELNADWIENRWKNEGALIPRLGKPIGVTNEAVREWLTNAQNASSKVIGGLEEGSRAEVKNLLEDVAHDVWQEHLNKVSRTHPELVRNIREYDRRASGLLALESVMEQRARKDSEGILGFARKNEGTVDKLATAGAASAAALGKPLEAATGLASYAALKKLPLAASYVNDKALVPVQEAIARGPSATEILQTNLSNLAALANRGETWAVVAKQAAQVGIPQGVARALYERTRAQSTGSVQ